MSGHILINGLRGSNRYSEWVGWLDKDAKIVVDFGKIETINCVTVGCIIDYGMAVHLPSMIKLSTSEDGVIYKEVAH